MLKLIFNLCLPQQSFLNYRKRQLFFPSLNLFKFWKLQAYFYSVFHVLAFKLHAASHRVVFKPVVWFFTATIPWKSKDRNIASKISFLRTMKTLRFNPCKISVAHCLQPADSVSVHVSFYWLSSSIHVGWLGDLFSCVCVCVVDEAWFHHHGYRHPCKI